MNSQQATLLCRLVKAACPQQAIEQHTPDLWADLLADIRYEDAEHAVKALAQRQPFIAPSEIRAEVRRLRDRRLDNAPAVQPPADLDPDNPTEYRLWLHRTRHALANGETIPQPELERREMPQLERVFRTPA